MLNYKYFWSSLVAQLVKNLPAVRETWVRSLGWEVPLEKGKATHSGIMAWRTVVLKKTLESPLDCKEIQSVHLEGTLS